MEWIKCELERKKFLSLSAVKKSKHFDRKLDDVYPDVFHKRPIVYLVYWKYLVNTLEPILMKSNTN